MSKKGETGDANTSGVYVLDKEFAWVPAKLIEQTGDTAKVSIPTYADEASILTDGGKGAQSWREETVSLKHYPGQALPLQNLQNGVLNEKEDMVDLPFLHEVSIIFAEPRGHSLQSLDGSFVTHHFFCLSFHRPLFCSTLKLVMSRRCPTHELVTL